MSCVFFYFKKLSLNTEQKFKFLYHLIGGERLLSVVVGVRLLVEKPLDFHDTTFSVSYILFKVKQTV